MSALDITARSATTTPSPGIRQTAEIAKLIDESKCIGCKACQVACMTWNDLRDEIGENVGVYDNPSDLTPNSWTVMRFFEVETESNHLEWLIRKDGCLHCDDPGCLKACPAPGAIVKYSNGIVDFVSENCIGCGYCVAGCPFDVPRISKKDNKAYKCTLCSDRVAVGQAPACAKACPTGAIGFGTKADMQGYAEKRVGELKERGFKDAGLYDPQGVGGTHVMYVLKHADKPELEGLPKDPELSPMVSFWKGVTKPIATALMGLAVFGGFLHYVTVGPKEVDESGDEKEAKSEKETA